MHFLTEYCSYFGSAHKPRKTDTYRDMNSVYTGILVSRKDGESFLYIIMRDNKVTFYSDNMPSWSLPSFLSQSYIDRLVTTKRLSSRARELVPDNVRIYIYEPEKKCASEEWHMWIDWESSSIVVTDQDQEHI
jgi:hypothetical protein